LMGKETKTDSRYLVSVFACVTVYLLLTQIATPQFSTSDASCIPEQQDVKNLQFKITDFHH
jgi:hypothetical protein